ncbi:MAG: hypothetical protein ACFCUI_10950 [Bernardetiaceae bacterium]
MTRYFVTYFDKNYLSKGLALWQSLTEQQADFCLFVLALDDFVVDFFAEHSSTFGTSVRVFPLIALENHDPALAATKSNRSRVEYYFTITPCVLRFVLDRYPEVDMITYLDADVYFFASPERIFSQMGEKSVIIVPHHFSEKNQHLARYGTYNVVFNTFRRHPEGERVLDWWRERCLEWCYDRLEDENDRFADQRYLDRFPSLSDSVFICTDKGANLAAFNIDNSQITQKNGQFYADQYPLIFYHFHYLRRINQRLWLLYETDKWRKEDFYCKEIQAVYGHYIRTVMRFEQKYQLDYINSVRNITSASLNHYLLNEYPLLVTPWHIQTLNFKKYPRLYRYLFSKISWLNS